MSDEQARLGQLRVDIDRLDQEIMDLISKRAECAQEVARVKMEANPGEDVFFYRPEREAQVLRRIKESNPGPLSGEEMARLFREIMSACLALEKPMHFGHSVVSVPLPAIDAVFREVESGAAHYGVVPVENSTEGMINHTLDMFMSSPLKICGEVQLRIHHHLMVSPKHQGQDIVRIYSHQQSLLSGSRSVVMPKQRGAQRKSRVRPRSQETWQRNFTAWKCWRPVSRTVRTTPPVS